MQSIFRLPWCSDQTITKLTDKMSLDPLRASTMVELPGLAKLKRKFPTTQHSVVSDNSTQPRMQAPKKARLDHSRPQQSFPASPKLVPVVTTAHSTPPLEPALRIATPSADKVAARPAVEACPVKLTESRPASARSRPATSMLQTQTTSDMAKLKQVIENEFNMQILMKHNELRLIEQEMAKCQIALEQLRRCEIRPFPGHDRPSLAVSAGTGPAILPPQGMTKPSHPAPYGVVDGPYTRHYRQWLLPDLQFDSVPVALASQMESAERADARPTRNGIVARKSSSKSVSSPTIREAPTGLAHLPPQAPRDKSSPLVLRRSTDGHLVKLICNNCLRGNFSSIQGFLNHCRIAHKVDYKSHDAAAIDCGRLLDEQEAATLSVEPTPASAPKSSVTTVRPHVQLSTPSKNLVHPLNAPGEPKIVSIAKRGSTARPKPVMTMNDLSPVGSSQDGSAFRASKMAPHLSAHFSKFKLGGDLHEAVAAAKQHVPLHSFDDDATPSESSAPVSPMEILNEVQSEKVGLVGRPVSRKAHREPAQRPRPSPLVPVDRHASPDYLDSTPLLTPNLSPHGTDSNPGLVSDHEDDDHGSGSEYEVPHAASLGHTLPVRRDCSDHMDIDVIEDDDLNEHGVVIRRNSMLAVEDGLLASATASPSRPAAMDKSAR